MRQILLNEITVPELLTEIEKLIDKKLGEKINSEKKQAQPQYISRKEVTVMLKISLPTLHEWTKSGRLPSYRIGARVLYKADEIEKALTKRNFGSNFGR